MGAGCADLHTPREGFVLNILGSRDPLTEFKQGSMFVFKREKNTVEASLTV